MTEAEIAWCAGLFEGEGCTNYHRKYDVRFMIKMTDLDVLEKFQAILGGKIYGPHQYGKPTWKPVWELRISNWANVLAVLDKIYPWLCSRRRAQVDAVRAHAPKYPRGVLVCPPEPIAWYRGYDRHRQLGIPVCDVCRASLRLWFKERNERNRDSRLAAMAALRARRKSESAAVRSH